MLTTQKSKRGFASMTPEVHRQIASRGGKAAHARGTAHEFSSEEASKAATIGHVKGTAHEFTSEEARIAGRKGGFARARKHAAKAAAQLPAADQYRKAA